LRTRDESEGDELQLAFWRMHVNIGIALYVLGAASVLVYAFVSPHHANRVALVALDLASIVLSLTVFWWLGLRLVGTRWRDAFFAAWSGWTIVFIGVGAALDGGARSPLAYLLVIPLLFAGLAYPPAVVTGLAAGALATSLVVGLVSPHGDGTGTGVMTLAMGIAGILTVAGATNRQHLTRDLVRLATHDGLTAVLTRRAFRQRVYEEIARAQRYGRTFSLVMVDVDGLKRLNDSRGHRSGDEALTAVATALAAEVRGTDLVGRLGGDEFGVLLTETGPGDVAPALERLRSSCAASGPTGTTASFGASVWGGPEDTLDALLRRADGALYAAKRAGRNRCVAWEPSLGAFSS
jgi:diguanylate cyclase (GGDEF)-like protein